MASMTLARRGSSGGPIHGVHITADEVGELLGWLAAMPVDQRRQVAGLQPERADIIVAGIAVAAELLEGVKAGAVTVSGFGLRDGVLLEMVGVV
jgi:exopolyphosphatase/guanosine-5'-triphosphate,3'-diphosphate pyrophosphatase